MSILWSIALSSKWCSIGPIPRLTFPPIPPDPSPLPIPSMPCVGRRSVLLSSAVAGRFAVGEDPWSIKTFAEVAEQMLLPSHVCCWCLRLLSSSLIQYPQARGLIIRVNSVKSDRTETRALLVVSRGGQHGFRRCTWNSIHKIKHVHPSTCSVNKR